MWDADADVEKLEYKFKPYVDYEGVSPEPTTEQVAAFFDQLRLILDRPEDEDLQGIAAHMEAISSNIMTYSDEKLIAAYADLLSGQPSREQIGALPHRLRMRFMGDVFGRFANPE